MFALILLGLSLAADHVHHQPQAPDEILQSRPCRAWYLLWGTVISSCDQCRSQFLLPLYFTGLLYEVQSITAHANAAHLE
jgi:hypothetical protein